MQIPLTIVVSEPAPFWLPELQRQFYDEDHIEVQELQDAKQSASVLVIDLDGATGAALQLLAERTAAENHQGTRPAAKIAIARPNQIDVEWPLREFGLTAFLTRPLDGAELADVCRRAFAAQTSPTQPT